MKVNHPTSLAFGLALLLGLSGMLLAPADRVAAADDDQFRAYWVDAFGEGIFNPAQVDELVSDAMAGNFNALVVQVGRRGDCFCNNAIMPRTQAFIDPLPYDPLQTLIDKAHAEGIEVHAWIIATAIWNSGTAPRDPNHVYNTHGPSKTGTDNWIMPRYDGSRPGDTYLDPGHPDAADYIVSMYTSVVENYDVDGINFDRIRYPDGQLAAWPADNSWGYNPVALERFHAATGRTDKPLPDDAEWSQWRRDQITNIVRRVYLESHALKPGIVISADTITYGDGPGGPDSPGGWEQSRPYRETLQDWRAWMEEGILDLNIPMNYKREFCTGGPIPGCFGGFSQQAWYEHWNDFVKDHAYDRQVAVGSAVYLNSISDSIIQARKALADSSAGNPSHGWVAYSYRTPDTLTNTGQRSGDESRAELTRALTEPSEYDEVTPPVFAAPAAVPVMPWLAAPTTGHVLASVTDADGEQLDQVQVELYEAETDALVGTRLTDGSGWFGFVDLAPGRYKAMVDGDVVHGQRVVTFSVVAGQVTEVAITPMRR
jgi:uncharacterized lipoprotein YddW (UPF0748 family)